MKRIGSEWPWGWLLLMKADDHSCCVCMNRFFFIQQTRAFLGLKKANRWHQFEEPMLKAMSAVLCRSATLRDMARVLLSSCETHGSLELVSVRLMHPIWELLRNPYVPHQRMSFSWTIPLWKQCLWCDPLACCSKCNRVSLCFTSSWKALNTFLVVLHHFEMAQKQLHVILMWLSLVQILN